MKTITIDNKHYIEGRIVMLPTKDITNIGKYIDSDNLVFNDHKSDIDRGKYQYLYLVCDLPIEINDWYIDDTNTLRQSVTSNKDYWSRRKDYKKVIVTTNKLMLKDLSYIPQLQPFSIKEFIERRGKDVDVLVEVDVQNFLEKENSVFEEKELISIKLNPDNTVNLIFK